MTESAATNQPAAVGVDIGGTNLRVALVSASGMVLRQQRVPSPTGSGERLLERLMDVHGALTSDLADPGIPVGLGLASIVRDGRVAVHGPNLQIGELDLVAALGERGLDRVVVENDANAAMYGEWKAGAAVGHDHALMVTLGTGLGGGAIVHGHLLRGANGFGGEAGHIGLVLDGRPCACGRRGCLEAYAAGSAIAVTAQERLHAGASSSLGSLDVVDGAAVSAAAAAGDALAVDVLEQVGHWLGVGLTGMVNLLDPAVVVVGGGAAAANGRWLLPAAQRVVDSEIEGAPQRVAPRLTMAQLGDDAGIIGAALLAIDHLQPRPTPGV